jgi:D-glycero-D-manno-heptose 1,7-bisphosphate phosphatase
LVILDRDGVINHDSEHYIRSPADWHPIEGSLAAIARLNQAGYRVMVATNQSGIARGLFTLEDMLQVHEKMNQKLVQVGGQIDAVFFCPHGPEEGCPCRKPRPGLLLDIARRLGVSLEGVPAVGDSVRDLQAARAVRARPILVRTGNGAETERLGEGLEGAEIFDDLAAFSHHLLGR